MFTPTEDRFAVRPFSIIIPSKNMANVAACVEALRHCDEDCRVIVVDDGLTHWRPDVHYVGGRKPFVYARNVNIGIRAAGTDDVIICGDDTRLLTRNGFANLAHSNYNFLTGESLGIVSAGITDAVGNWNQVALRTGAMRPEKRMLCFVAVHIAREVLDKVGLLDEELIGYGCDDGAYCWRARQSGYQLWVNDGVAVEHGVLPSEFRGHGVGDWTQNAERFQKKYGISYLEACG